MNRGWNDSGWTDGLAHSSVVFLPSLFWCSGAVQCFKWPLLHCPITPNLFHYTWIVACVRAAYILVFLTDLIFYSHYAQNVNLIICSEWVRWMAKRDQDIALALICIILYTIVRLSGSPMQLSIELGLHKFGRVHSIYAYLRESAQIAKKAVAIVNVCTCGNSIYKSEQNYKNR